MEGFGISLVEASACGIPVVGARQGGIPDAVREGETGLLVEFRSYYGPTMNAFEAATGRDAELQAELEALFIHHNTSPSAAHTSPSTAPSSSTSSR